MGSPPNCRPECTINPDCPSNRACINEKCSDPCPGSCGFGAICNVIHHIPACSCPEDFTGDPFNSCQPLPPERKIFLSQFRECIFIFYLFSYLNLSCGPNAECNNGVCTCLPEYRGNPYELCRPECVLNNDCPQNRACVRNKCIDPCIGTCGQNAICNVYNHVPMCSCPNGMSGNAFILCTVSKGAYPSNSILINFILILFSICIIRCFFLEPFGAVDLCRPSPCGPNSQCRIVNQQAVCSCVQGYLGAPPSCRPECVVSSDCPRNLACNNQKCIDPCTGTCGLRTQCQVVNHNPICSCLPRYSGDPFTRCDPSCTCLPEFIGSPPNCRPECVSNSECASHLACMKQKCRDPCPGACGSNTECRVVSHTPMCVCLNGYTGDPFTQCVIQERKHLLLSYTKYYLNY